MNATNLYVTTCRLVMHAQPENRDTWLELYQLLPYLRQSLSCTVCGKLLIEPYTPTETTCQHHVCKMCLGGKKRLKPTCSWCKDYDMYVDNAQIKLLLQCYRKLCEYIKFTPIYCKLNSIYNNGGQLSLIEMIDEAIGKTNNNKCEDINSIHCDEYESDSKENIELLTDTHNEIISLSSLDDSFKENSVFDECTNETEIPLTEEKNVSKEEILVSETEVSEVNIAVTPINTSESECKEEIIPLPVHTQPQHTTLGPSSLGIGLVQSPPPITSPVCSTIPSPVSSPSSGSLNAVKSPAVPTQTPLLPAPHHHYPSQMIPPSPAPLPTGTSTSGSSGPGCPFAPGTIFSSTKSLFSHSVVGDMVSFPQKHNNSSVNNGSSSMYSVMYADGDSTKITIKRKPPGMETPVASATTTTTCTSKTISIPVEPETTIPDQELIKKPKPKPKPKPKRKGCRCGNATPTPGKLTCCGQRCPCYVEAKACIECRCRGCRNPHRPGGKKVRPVIPQLANIQIHPVQPVHGRSSSSSITSSSSSFTTTTPSATTTSTTNTPLIPSSISSPAIANTSLPQTIRAVQAMHAVQAVHGVNTTVQAMTGGMHQLITLGGGVVQTPLSQSLGVHPMTGIAMKPVSLALTSVPAQLLINDDRSTSASTSDNSDVDIDI